MTVSTVGWKLIGAHEAFNSSEANVTVCAKYVAMCWTGQLYLRGKRRLFRLTETCAKRRAIRALATAALLVWYAYRERGKGLDRNKPKPVV